MSILNIAKTRSGRRLFKFWLNHPITVKTEIEQRLDAVEFLRSCPILNSLRQLLSKNHWDFEVSLTSAINLRIDVNKFKLVLSTMSRISEALASIVASMTEGDVVLPNFFKTLTDQIIINFSILPNELLKPVHEDIISTQVTDKIKDEINQALQDLEDHKKEICKSLGLLSFQYSTVSGE